MPATRPLSPGELAELAQNPRGLIDRLLARTYRDCGRRLLQLAGAWLEANRLDVAATAARPFLLAAPEFEIVWERMLADVLHDPTEVLGVGQGFWTPAVGASKPGIAPRADAIRLWTRTAPAQRFVFDAKDKRIKRGGPSGSEGDHYKQTLYGLLAARASPTSCCSRTWARDASCARSVPTRGRRSQSFRRQTSSRSASITSASRRCGSVQER